MGQEQINAQALLPGKPEVPRALQELPGTGDPPLPKDCLSIPAILWNPSHPSPLQGDGQEKLGAKGFILVGNKSGGDLFF